MGLAQRVSMMDRMGAVVDEGVGVRGSIVEVDIGICTIVRGCTVVKLSRPTYRLRGSCVFLEDARFTGSYD
jgi:hypothetical protein